jgi:uncharacterized protein YbbC (DUF1343 family)/CubicO group peptidase (beta-lactamase class C family)
VLLITWIHSPAPADERFSQIGQIVGQEIAAGHIPGAVVVVGQQGRIVYRGTFGSMALMPVRTAMRGDAIFDLASLTKVIATTTAIMQLAEAGRLLLDKPVAEYWPEFASAGKNGITVRQLLTHTSGLRPDLDPNARWSGPAEALALIAADHPIQPPGTRFIYSDLNFITLGELVHRITSEPLDVYAMRHIFAPLRMEDTGFHPALVERARIVPTDLQEGRLRWGEVQDPTAYRMGGVAGHAGLFSTADDIARFAEMLLNGGSNGGRRILQRETVAEMTSAIELPGGERRGLGWDVSSSYAAGVDIALGGHAYGHTGYTGTMLWIDPSSDTFLIVLSSRLHPDGHGDVKLLRQRLAEVVAAAKPSSVLAGIDVMAQLHFAPLAGHRIGLLTNQTGRDSYGSRTIDLLAAAPAVRLAAIFTPEHGLNGDQEGPVGPARDAATGLPIYSLYGSTRRPTGAMLAGLDAIVVDLQDAGVRFYTYPTTVGYLLEEAARHSLDVYVLDRPNPVNASIVQGPVMNVGLRSFMGYFPLPVRHGMTLGELATLFNAEYRIGAKLTVIPMRGYRRRMWYDETGLPWVNPSPNLRSVDEATLYGGVGLIEGANISVGRGTASPFELVGAPWIDGATFTHYLTHRGIRGVRFEPVQFIPGADRYAALTCQGVRVILTDRANLDLALLGLELAAALYRLYPSQFRLEATLPLIGSRKVLTAIASDVDPRDVMTSWQTELTTFENLRLKYLLYPVAGN